MLADKLAPSGVGGTDKFYRPIIRVSPSRERVQGQHVLCEHALTGKLTSSAACGNSRLHHSINRVPPSARRCCARHMEIARAVGRVRASMSSLTS